MSGKHTKGPWEAEFGHNGRVRGIIQSEGKRGLFAHDRSDAELIANARLIAEEYPSLSKPLLRICVGAHRKWQRFDQAGLLPVPTMPPSISGYLESEGV